MFLGTPHRGTENAGYGQVLATLARTVMDKPSQSLINTLKNSEALMQLTNDFRFQITKYQVFSFYELRPMKKKLSNLVSKKKILLLMMVSNRLEVSVVTYWCCGMALLLDSGISY